MSFPAGWAVIPVTGQYTLRDGSPARGYVNFVSAQITLGDGKVILPCTFGFNLDATGSFSGQLPATDDPAFTPTGWAYTVFENMQGARAPFQIQVPHTSSGIDMSTVASVAPPGPLVHYVDRKITALGNITGAVALDLSAGGVITATLTGNVTFSLTNLPPSTYVADIELRLTQDATGSRTAAWPANGKWPGAAPFVLSTAASAMDVVGMSVDSTGAWIGYPVEDVG